MKLLLYITLIIFISGNTTEIPRILIPTGNYFRIIYYVVFPLLFLLSTIKINNFNYFKCQKEVKKFIIYSFIMIMPLLALFFFEFIIFSITGINSITAREVLIKDVSLLIFVLFIVMSYKYMTIKEFVKIIMKPYVYLVIFISAAQVVISLFLFIGLVDIFNWTIPNYLKIGNDFASGRVEYLYMPFYLTILEKDQLGVLRFQGLSQEPHTYALFSSPAFFIFLYNSNNWNTKLKYLCGSLIIISNLLTLSLTYFFSFFIIILLLLFRYFIYSNKKVTTFLKISILIILCAIFLSYIYLSIDEINIYVYNKIMQNSIEDTSSDYNLNLIDFDMIVGSGVLSSIEFLKIGVLEIILYGLCLINIIYFSIKLLFSNTLESYLAFPILYYIIHSSKDPFHSILEPLFIYLILILALGLSTKSRRFYLRSS